MEEKLRSISRRISWSSLLKAAIFAAAWWALPFWLFALLALYLYFVPSTGAQKTAAPFFVLLLTAFLEGQGWVAALIFGAAFYCILLIKDLIIVDRRAAYEILMLALGYLLSRAYFIAAGGAPLGAKALVYGIAAAWGIGAMAAGLIKHFSSVDIGKRRMLGWLAFLLSWQLFIVGTFLPLDFLYQSAIVFLAIVIPLDLVPQYAMGELPRMRALVSGMLIFALLVIVAASARWVI